MPRYLTEAIGTFFLVLAVGLARGPLAPVAIGSVLMAMVYMGGHVSGAHYNPAVSLAIFLRGKLKGVDLLPYILAQLAGAALAAGVVRAIGLEGFMPGPNPGAETWVVLAIEALFTFALALVVLNVATTRATQDNSYFGLAIGFTVAGAAAVAGPISGGVFNPAVGLGPALVQVLAGGDIAHVWLYVVAPVAGAAVAALAFKAQHLGTNELAGPPVPPAVERAIKPPTPAGPTSRP
ncbi:MAG TPA: aquaporin [Phycisphaerales bacterium]|nr:aquaporin [Phycisphaerales bacterium]